MSRDKGIDGCIVLKSAPLFQNAKVQIIFFNKLDYEIIVNVFVYGLLTTRDPRTLLSGWARAVRKCGI